MMGTHYWTEFHTCDLGKFSVSALFSDDLADFYVVVINIPGEKPFPFDYPDSRRDAISLCNMAKLVADQFGEVAYE